MTPIVLIHGIGGAVWGPTIPALAPARVIEFDLPGYGGSAPLAATTFPAIAAALRDRLDAAGVAKAHVVGHSIGGMAAQEFALAFPARVDGLVLYATTPAFGGRDPAFAQAFLTERLEPLDRGMTMRDLAIASMPPMLGEHAAPEAIEALIAAMAAVPEATYRATLACLTTFDRRADLARITAPTLLLGGEDDMLAPVPTLLRMSLAIPGARLHVLPHAGHLAHLQRPDAFNTAVRDFLLPP